MSQVLRPMVLCNFIVTVVFSANTAPATSVESTIFSQEVLQHLNCIIMLHVDDILFVSTGAGRQEIENAIREFAHIGFLYLSVADPITFCGVEIRLMRDATIEISQHEFYDKLAAPKSAELVSNNCFIQSSDSIRRHLKSFTGACIWLYQTRFDIIYEVSRLASSVPDAISKPLFLTTFIKSADKLMNRIANEHAPLKFPPCELSGPRAPQLFVFADASFASLRNSGSTEALCIIYGVPHSRNGPVQCRGNILLFFCSPYLAYLPLVSACGEYFCGKRS